MKQTKEDLMMKNYHSKISEDGKHSIDRAQERLDVQYTIKDLKKIAKLICKGAFKPLYGISCEQGRVAYVGQYKGKRIIPVYQKWNNRVTTILPPWVEDGVNVEDCAITSLGRECSLLDALVIEKGRQTPPLN